MTEKDWTLLVIAAAKGRPVSPVQLQKALFLLSRNLSPDVLGVERLYDFQAYDYGPFDGSVYHDAEELERAGDVVIDQAGSRFRSYRATSEGSARADRMRQGINAKAIAYLDRVVAWVSGLSFNQLVEAIYKAYPDMATNSVFRR